MRSVQLKCYRCGKENDVIDMRYAALNRMICKSCMEKGKTQAAEQIPSKKVQNSAFEIKNVKETTIKSDKSDPHIEYTCIECHYTFKRKKSASVTSCPYCGIEGSLEVKSGKDAEYYLNEYEYGKKINKNE